ncbi:hypothetical protein C8J57DRAFT_1529749 [Mycena rebaudengoi]|nr:hypothetical protein C8J57DRAFT_1529749 [Mycena rebaudengoi]
MPQRQPLADIVAGLSVPPPSDTICFPHNLRQVLNHEIKIVADLEQHHPYYLGLAHSPPPTVFDVLDEASDYSTDSDSGSDSDSDSNIDIDMQTDLPTPPSSLPKSAKSALPFVADFSPYNLWMRLIQWSPLDNITLTPDVWHKGHLLALVFEEYHWDYQPTHLIDHSHHAVGVLFGSPNEQPTWEVIVSRASDAIALAALNADHKQLAQQSCIRAGLQYGGKLGTNIPHRLTNMAVCARLRYNENVHVIAGFQNRLHQLYAPRLFNDCVDKVQQIRNHGEGLHLPFDEAIHSEVEPPISPFTTVEYDFGGSTSPLRYHERDLFYAWRSVTSLGVYDSRHGGHLILWDLRRIILFPPGSTFLFPGALIRYSFVAIEERTERQFLLTQYSDAGHYRYLANGFSPKASVEPSQKSRVDAAVQLYSYVDDFE